MQSVNILKVKKMNYSSMDAYKALKNKLEFFGNAVRVIAFTSCDKAAGTSSVALNAARYLAGEGKRVLLIEANMVDPIYDRRHRLHAGVGLAQFLSGKSELDDVLCQTNIENLYMIAAGETPTNKEELLGSQIFMDFLVAAREKFDYVLLDTPVCAEKSALSVAKASDGVCMVLEAKKTDYRDVQQANSFFEENGCKVLGVILNKYKLKDK